MKRRLLTIAVFLLLGAVVNVAVAWGCALFVSYGTVSGTEVGRDDPRARDLVGSKRPGMGLVIEGSGYGHEFLRVIYRTDPSPKSSVRTEEQHTVRAGLPLRCLVGRLNSVSTGSEESEEYVGAWPLPRQRKSPFLPLRPLWPGFALNTLIYAAILWLLIPGPFVLRRFLRVKRGLCPKCAYPMGESGVRTECGRLLPKRVAT